FGAHADDPRITDLERRGVPFILVGQRDGVRSVAADDLSGGRLAAEHLLRLGHRRVLHVTGDLQSQVLGDRADAFFAAFAAADMPKPRLVECDELSALGAYRAMARDLTELPTDVAGQPRAATFPLDSASTTDGYSAIFAATDELATGVIAALKDSGARVPADVSVVGFDDMP